MYGTAPAPAATRTPPSARRSPYGAAKLYAHWATAIYREGYGMFAVSGILFNHESPRRGETFVTRKVSRAVARIQAGLADYLYMGNLDGVRDWGYAPEYVEGMWRMLQADEPRDYVLATGTSYTVRDFVVAAFEHAGLDWEKHVRHRRALPAAHRAVGADRRREPGRARARVEGAGLRQAARARSWSTPTSRPSSTRASPGSTGRGTGLRPDAVRRQPTGTLATATVPSPSRAIGAVGVRDEERLPRDGSSWRAWALATTSSPSRHSSVRGPSAGSRSPGSRAIVSANSATGGR